MDPFDSTALFAEFNRPRESSDKILMRKLKTDTSLGSIQVPDSRKIPKDDSSSSSGSDSDSDAAPDTENGEAPNDAATDDRTQGTRETGEGENHEPVEIGTDASGNVRYRPGIRERLVGARLLQHAAYQDETDETGMGNMAARTISPTEEAQNMKLKHQYDIFKKQTRLIDPTRHIPATVYSESPVIQVLYMNNDIARKYRVEIERFIWDLIQQDTEEERMKTTKLRPHNITLAEGGGVIREDQGGMHLQKASTVIGCSRYYKDFSVDPMGFPLVDYIPALSYGWEIPRYEQVHRKALPVSSDDEAEEEAKPERQKNTCFNCEGDHRISECTEQRDFARISENRRKFQNRSQGMNASLTKGSGRLLEDDPRFNKFKPGQYSEALIEALGVEKQCLPPFIYKMRVLGYPPGYLKEAEIEHSGISMFDRDGKALRTGDRDINSSTLEDGEMDDDAEDTKVVYNLEKLVDFPGFNVPPAEGIQDVAYKYGLPPMLPHHSKEHMKQSLPTPRGHKRRQSKEDESGSASKRQRVELADMDLDESEPGVSPSTPPHLPLSGVSYSYWGLPNNTFENSSQYPLTPPRPPEEEEGEDEGNDCQYLAAPPPPPPLPPGSPPHTPTPPPLPPESPPLIMDGLSGDTPPRTIPLERCASICADAGEEGRSGAKTPTLEDLQRAQQLLVQQLETASQEDDSSRSSAGDMPPPPTTPAPPPPLPNDLPPETPPRPPLPTDTPPVTPVPLPPGAPPETPPNPPLPVGTPPVTPRTPQVSHGTPLAASTPGGGTPGGPGESPNTSLNRSASASLSRTLSTPVTKVNKVMLPDSSLFRSGVQEHIPYENLPDAVGTYDKMKDILSDIRRLKKKSS